MSAILTIARREISAFFVSPIAYVVLTVWLLFFGIVFYIAGRVVREPAARLGARNLLEAFFGGTRCSGSRCSCSRRC